MRKHLNGEQNSRIIATAPNCIKKKIINVYPRYGTYQELEPVVSKVVLGKERVLVIGCGNSDFSTEMYLKGGYQNITNVDFR